MLTVKNYQVAFFDSLTGTCFDETFYEPSEAETAIDFLRPDRVYMERCFWVQPRVFINFTDGRQFELVCPEKE